MRSSKPKVLHELGGKAMLLHVIDCAKQLNPRNIHIVVGHEADQVIEHVKRVHGNELLNWAHQTEQNGTGHAAAQAIDQINPSSTVIILAGDVPLLTVDTITPLAKAYDGINLLTVNLPNPSGFGRIVRKEDGRITAIVEHKDATDDQLAITEINTGVMAMPAIRLATWLSKLGNNNAQGEYYLTDVIGLADDENMPINGILAKDANEVAGINSRAELARLERIYQFEQAQQWMTNGVSFADPNRVDFRGDCEIGEDSFIDVNVILEGKVNIASNVKIGPNSIIKNTTIGPNTRIEANCVIENAVISQGCVVGPFARLRPGAVLAAGAKVGNFVEIKKSHIGKGSKVNHLSYVGDSTIGENVNIGAGVITCNYDGVNKHQTIIGDDVFIGSDCQLIAPLTIGAGATVGAGSTIAKDVPPETLTLSRSPQRTIEAWRRPKKEQF